MSHSVSDDDTAIALGSGDLPVLATPRLIAWLEAATVHAAADRLEPGQTSVGTGVRVRHRRATAVGGQVQVTANVIANKGKRLTFAVQAIDAQGQLIADGEVDRVIVDRDRFIESSLRRPGLSTPGIDLAQENFSSGVVLAGGRS